MKVLGIDPGLKITGYGLIEAHQNQIKLIETGTIQTESREPMPYRLKTVYTLLNELMEQHRPEVLVLEKLYAHYKLPTTASILGHARGVVCLLCAQKNIELIEQSVKRIRKAITGNGNASKIQTKHVVAYLLKIDEAKLILDASDALALALGYIDLRRRKI